MPPMWFFFKNLNKNKKDQCCSTLRSFKRIISSSSFQKNSENQNPSFSGLSEKQLPLVPSFNGCYLDKTLLVWVLIWFQILGCTDALVNKVDGFQITICNIQKLSKCIMRIKIACAIVRHFFWHIAIKIQTNKGFFSLLLMLYWVFRQYPNH
jgi:hypothetical protein